MLIYTWRGKLLADYVGEIDRATALAQFTGEEVAWHIGQNMGLGTGSHVTYTPLSAAALLIADGVINASKRPAAIAAIRAGVPAELRPLVAKTGDWREWYE